MARASCPHHDGMVPVNSSDILHLFQYIQPALRPPFYRLGNWPQLFCKCVQCNRTGVPDHYELLTWDKALAWAQEPTNG